MNYDEISYVSHDEDDEDAWSDYSSSDDVGFMSHSDSCCAFGQPWGEYTRKTNPEADERSWKELCFILTKTKQNGRPSLVFTKDTEALDELLDICPYAYKAVETKSRHGNYMVSCWIVSHEHD